MGLHRRGLPWRYRVFALGLPADSARAFVGREGSGRFRCRAAEPTEFPYPDEICIGNGTRASTTPSAQVLIYQGRAVWWILDRHVTAGTRKDSVIAAFRTRWGKEDTLRAGEPNEPAESVFVWLRPAQKADVLLAGDWDAGPARLLLSIKDLAWEQAAVRRANGDPAALAP